MDLVDLNTKADLKDGMVVGRDPYGSRGSK